MSPEEWPFLTSYPKYDNPAFGSPFLIPFPVVTSCSIENHSFSYGCAPPKMRTLMYLYFFSKMIHTIIFGCTSSRRFTLLIQFFSQLQGKFFHCLLLPHERAFPWPDFWSDSISHMGVSYLPTAVNSLSTRLSLYPQLKHSDFWSDNISALD